MIDSQSDRDAEEKPGVQDHNHVADLGHREHSRLPTVAACAVQPDHHRA